MTGLAKTFFDRLENLNLFYLRLLFRQFTLPPFLFFHFFLIGVLLREVNDCIVTVIFVNINDVVGSLFIDNSQLTIPVLKANFIKHDGFDSVFVLTELRNFSNLVVVFSRGVTFLPEHVTVTTPE